MSRERWGTFSVVDHQHQRAFVADVLLYDRLIIPFPSGAEERARWISIGWDPDRLDQNLKILGNTAIRVPWDQQKRDVFETRFAAAKRAAFDTKNLAHAKQSNLDPFHVTRTLLAHEFLPDLPKGVSKVWPLAAYPSFNKYQEDTILLFAVIAIFRGSMENHKFFVNILPIIVRNVHKMFHYIMPIL